MPSFAALLPILAALAILANAQSFAVGGPGRFPCSKTDATGKYTADSSKCTPAAMLASQICPPAASVLGQVNSVDGGPGSKSNGTT